MLPSLLIAIGILVGLWLAYDWFTRTNPAAIRRGLKWLALAALVGFGAFLVLTGKLAGLFAVAAGLMPWIARAIRAHALWRMARQWGIRMKGGQASAGNTSQVRTRFLAMELDHDTGRLDGEVTQGAFAGRRLASLDLAQAVELWRQVQADPDSVQVLETWLDRTWPDWRPQDEPAERPAPGAAMTLDEAREILGIGPDATTDDIRAAHRRLMMANHPDHGGSTWIAARLNQARDLLLGE